MVNKMSDSTKHKKIFDKYKKLLYFYFNCIGPKSKFEIDDKEIFHFKDNVYFNFDEYYKTAIRFKNEILDKIIERENQINLNSTFVLFNYLCKFIYKRIKSREKNINEFLKAYLKDEDISESFSEMHNKLADSFNNNKYIFITNLISLKGFDTLTFGNIKIATINDNNINLLPANIERPYTYPLERAIVISLNKPLTRKEFVKEYKDKTFIEIIINGYHFNGEESEVFKQIIVEYRLLLSYFLLYEQYLSFNWRIPEKKNPFKYNKIGPNDKIINYIYFQLNDTSKLKFIEHSFNVIGQLEKRLIINKKAFKLMKKIFYLDNFIKISQNKEYGEISKKFRRSLEWFLRSNEEKNETNKTIDLFISLETLMSTNPDSFTGYTNELAENIVIASFDDVDSRYKHKHKFKSKVYPLRNKIMHHGYSIDIQRDVSEIVLLKLYLILSFRWLLENIDKVNKIGNNSEALKTYFERKKLE